MHLFYLGVVILVVLSIFPALFGGSEGQKAGIVQQVSFRNLGKYYIAEIAFEGGKVVQANKNTSSYSNVQEFMVTKSIADGLDTLLGETVIVTYKRSPFRLIGPEAEILSYHLPFKKHHVRTEESAQEGQQKR